MKYEDLIYLPETSGPVRKIGEVNTPFLKQALDHLLNTMHPGNRQIGLRCAPGFEGVGDLRYNSVNPNNFVETDFTEWVPKTEFLQNIASSLGILDQGRVRLLLVPSRTCYSFHADQDLWRVHIPLITNKDAFMFVHGKMWHLPIGGAYLVHVEYPHCAVNMGAEDRTHIVFDWCCNIAGEV